MRGTKARLAILTICSHQNFHVIGEKILLNETVFCEPRDIDIVVTDYANDHLRRICIDNEVKLQEASAKASE